ncbi:MAG: hypothetical protein LBU64_11210 [Planctomycetota bacterium]|jgi:hypothetical protein|nr:hypothetical protein [Planctomycetota bacterium]
MLKRTNAVVPIALLAALPILSGCCPTISPPVPGCPETVTPSCEVDGYLAYNLGRGMFANSPAVKLDRGVKPEARVPGCLAGIEVSANPPGPGSCPAVGEPYTLPEGEMDDPIPGIVPAAILIPNSPVDPAPEKIPGEKGVLEPLPDSNDSPAEAIGEIPPLPEARALPPVADPPPSAAAETSPSPKAEAGPAAGKAEAGMLGKYESFVEKSPSAPESVIASGEGVPPLSVPPAPELDKVDALLARESGISGETAISNLPAVELPPNLE